MNRWRAAIRRRLDAAGRDCGASTIEYVITVPIIVTVTLLVVQFALVFMAHNAAAAAVQNGVSAAREYGSSAAAGRSATAAYLAEVAPRLVVSPSVSSAMSADTVTVSVDAQAPAVLPFVTIAVHASGSGPVEAVSGR